MKKSVLIISYVPHYNRQGYDLAECLKDAGYTVSLFQRDGLTDISRGVFGVRCIRPQGIFHKFHMIYNLFKFLLKTFFVRKQIIVCVGKPMLVLCGFYSFVFGSKLIWYSLEYSKLGAIDRFVYKHCVSGYIDVEENRRNAIFEEYGKKNISIICHNMPHLHSLPIKGGKLREYLKINHGIEGDTRLVIYAGSYQPYACLDNIVEASCCFDANIKLVLMTYCLPTKNNFFSANCIVVPPVQGDEFYEWLADADCALLPYEDKDDFNVMNCSPQKIFDCYLAGIPYVASNRPIIRQVLSIYPQAGVICDFTNVTDIVKGINEILSRVKNIKDDLFRLHHDKFNFGISKNKIIDLLESVYA